jgi:hypothetical protein
MLLFWFRAETLGGVLSGDPTRPDDPIYKFNSHGFLCFTVRRVKRGTAHIQDPGICEIDCTAAAVSLRCSNIHRVGDTLAILNG